MPRKITAKHSATKHQPSTSRSISRLFMGCFVGGWGGQRSKSMVIPLSAFLNTLGRTEYTTLTILDNWPFVLAK